MIKYELLRAQPIVDQVGYPSVVSVAQRKYLPSALYKGDKKRALLFVLHVVIILSILSEELVSQWKGRSVSSN